MIDLIVVFDNLDPFSLFAQVTQNVDNVTIDDQTIEWMTKIASNSELRNQMMIMMIDKTKGDKVEMNKLVNSLMDNPETLKTMQAGQPDRNSNNNISSEPRGMSGDSKKEMKITTPIIKK